MCLSVGVDPCVCTQTWDRAYVCTYVYFGVYAFVSEQLYVWVCYEHKYSFRILYALFSFLLNKNTNKLFQIDNYTVKTIIIWYYSLPKSSDWDASD